MSEIHPGNTSISWSSGSHLPWQRMQSAEVARFLEAATLELDLGLAPAAAARSATLISLRMFQSFVKFLMDRKTPAKEWQKRCHQVVADSGVTGSLSTSSALKSLQQCFPKVFFHIFPVSWAQKSTTRGLEGRSWASRASWAAAACCWEHHDPSWRRSPA